MIFFRNKNIMLILMFRFLDAYWNEHFTNFNNYSYAWKKISLS